MLEQDKKILSENDFLNKRKNDKEIIQFKKTKRLFFLLSIFLCLIIIAAIYLLSPSSNIKKITVENNIYLPEDKIVELSELTLNDKFILTIPSIIEKRIIKHQLIQECKVELKDDESINIVVEEYKQIGYAFENDNNVIILDNDDRFILDKESLYLIEKVPLIHGFSEDKIVLIEKNLVSVDYKMINEISEMHYFPSLKYQDIMLIMRDGNYVFTSVYGLNILNKYYDIDSSEGSKDNKCYYFEDISGNAYMSACPWQVIKEEVN